MVVKEEENFPRGGPVAVATKRHARSVEEPDLFKVTILVVDPTAEVTREKGRVTVIVTKV